MTPTYRRNCTRNIIFWSKLQFILFGMAGHAVTVKIGINGLAPDLYRNKHRINPEEVKIDKNLLGMAGHAE